MTTNECRCGRPARDDGYFCDTCGDDLSKALGDVPWLAEELEVTVTRQKGVDYRAATGGKGAKKPSERPSPVQWGAAEVRGHLKALLVSWALYCDQEGVRNQSPHHGLPADELGALSRWLLWRVDGLALNEIGPDAVEEIVSAVAHCRRVVDRPADRQFLGNCEEDECAGHMHGSPSSAWARCDTCDTPVKADVIRKRLLDELDDRLCTAAEIARLSTYLGLKADREQVRKRINAWAKRGRLEEASSFSDEATFRFGTVYAMLVAAEYGNAKAAG